MRVNDKIVTGIFTFVSGMTYTKDDLVINNNIIYVVTADEVTEEPSNTSTKYKEYTETRSITSIADMSNPAKSNYLVPVNLIKPLITTYINGLKGEGQITKLGNGVDISLYNSTGLFFIPNTALGIPTNLSSTLLLRVYMDSTTSYQELVDFDKKLIYTRKSINGTFQAWDLITPIGSPTKLNTYVSEISSRLTLIDQVINDTLSNSKYYALTLDGSVSANNIRTYNLTKPIPQSGLVKCSVKYNIGNTPYMKVITVSSIGFFRDQNFELKLSGNTLTLTSVDTTISTYGFDKIYLTTLK